MRVIDESLWKQALVEAASRYCGQQIVMGCLAGEAEVLERKELDVMLLPNDYRLSELPEVLVEYAYNVGKQMFGYALVSEDCSELYVMGLVKGHHLIWSQVGGRYAN